MGKLTAFVINYLAILMAVISIRFIFINGEFSQLFCDFETDLCSWRHEVAYTNGLKWSLSDPDTCAYGDAHCPYSNDRYLYTTSRVLTTNGSFVRIGHYPLAAQLTGKCTLSLKYIAFGIGFAKLVISIRMVGDRDPEPILLCFYTSH
uniref:MAM domain-containing protein n=1 Tax=Tetranychus urticae TaxID=32264 RepID=T1KXE3_TETUR